MLAAALLGCRLPTTGEWTAASILRPDDAEKSPTMNLRDRTFNDQQSGRSGRFRIDAEIFVPESRRGERIDSADFWLSNKVLGAGSGTYDDGEGFLSKVGPRGGPDLPLYSGMYDLVGNVAEYVFEQSDALDELPFAPKLDAFDRAAGAKKLGDAVRQVADIQRLSLRVAGASAFSPSKYGLTTAHALKLEQSQVGFSDVGFRLAYTDPLTPVIVRRTQKLIGALTYMTAADAPATATGGQNTQRPTGG